jgi:CheY-like chemotaxis protein
LHIRLEFFRVTAKQNLPNSVLVVEDEVMIRMMLTDMLEELGFDIAGETGDIDEAMSLVQAVDFDLAILDVNVNGKAISPVADLLEAQRRPFLFVTGYGSDALPDGTKPVPICRSRFKSMRLPPFFRALRALTGRAALSSESVRNQREIQPCRTCTR